MSALPETTIHPTKNILIVTGDCPSHPYACIKLATVLVEHHEVTVAGPNGSALSRLQAEAKRYNESATMKRKIRCLSIGDVTTKVHCNVRSVRNPQDYSSFQIIYDTLFNSDKYNPYGIANDFEQLMDDQVETYENLKRVIPEYDLVYAIHTAAGTVCDVIELLQQEGVAAVPPCILFSSLPYNSSFFYKGLWTTPRSIVALPHVATYSSPRNAFKDSSFFLAGLLSYLIQMFWMFIDTYHAEKAWRIAAKRTDSRRAARGLPPVHEGMRYYWMDYPVLSVGGATPYIAEGEPIADNATVVGAIRSTETSDLGRLNDWFDRANVSKIVYASFGTGTQLSVEEARNLSKLALSLENTDHRLLLCLSKGSQERLQSVFDQVLASEPTRIGDGLLEYMNGKFRIDSDVPQESLLLSITKVRVDLFVSHMGFGGYTEAVNGGISFVAYPAGCDQWYNTERAVEAGIAVKAQPEMKNLAITVQCALNNETLKKRSQQLAPDGMSLRANQIILGMAEELCGGENTEATSICSSNASTLE